MQTQCTFSQLNTRSCSAALVYTYDQELMAANILILIIIFSQR